MPRLHKSAPPVPDDVRPLNVWDCFRLAHENTKAPTGGVFPYRLDHRYTRLFGNAHIGCTELCNLQVPGLLALDAHAWIEHAYARINLVPELLSPRFRAAWHMWTSTTLVTLDIGGRPALMWSLKDLLEQRPWEPASVTEAKLPEDGREAFRRRVAARREEGDYPQWVPVRQNFSVSIEAAPMERVIDSLDTLNLTCWIHLEGYRQVYC